MANVKNTRPETGAMEFEDDWSGVFIRGDNAAWYIMGLEEIKSGLEIDGMNDWAPCMMALKSLLEVLKDSNQFVDRPKQLMKKFSDCIRAK